MQLSSWSNMSVPAAKRPKLDETFSAKAISLPPAATAAPATTFSLTDTPYSCAICLEDWDESGDHAAASLNCGHVFGQSCLKRWLSTARTCPTCKAKCKKKDMRKLYLPKVAGDANPDTSAQLTKELDEARKALEVAKATLAYAAYRDETENRVDNVGVQAMSREPHIIRQHGGQAEHSGITSGAERKTQPPMFNLHATIPLIAGYCVDYYPAKDWLLLSCSSATRTVDPVTAKKFSFSPLRLGSSHEPMKSEGLAIITNWDSLNRYYTFVPLHDKPVRCIAMSPHDNSLVMTSSLDGTACIINIETTQLVARFNKLPGASPIWACCWDSTHKNLVYLSCGSDVHIFNLNHPSTPSATLHLNTSPSPSNSGPRSLTDKIFALISVSVPTAKADDIGAPSHSSSLLVGTSWGIFLWVFDGPPQIYDLSSHLCFNRHLQPATWHMLAQRGDSNCFLTTFVQGNNQTQVVFGLNDVNATPFFEIELALSETPIGTSSAGCIAYCDGVNVIGTYSPIHKASTLLAPLSQKENASLVHSDERVLLKHTSAWKPISVRHTNDVYIIACSPSATRVLTPYRG